MSMAPPLRFLALVAGGWICLRAAMLAPGWRTEGQENSGPSIAAAVPPAPARLAAVTQAGPAFPPARARARPHPPAGRSAAAADEEPARSAPLPTVFARVVADRVERPVPPIAGAVPLRPPPRTRHWSVSAWLLLRDDTGDPALAAGGTLGGSQAGARLLRPVGHGLALSARLYLPLRRRAAAEAAAGLDWRPSRRLPLHLLAERRQALGSEGRSAFALTAYGGLSRELARGFRIDAYGQAGVVGTRSRDPFADGSVRVSMPLGPVELGGGAWAAAQPGAERIDAGPSVCWRLPVRGAALRLQADWRFRLAGDAAPGSGPALTLAADF